MKEKRRGLKRREEEEKRKEKFCRLKPEPASKFGPLELQVNSYKSEAPKKYCFILKVEYKSISNPYLERYIPQRCSKNQQHPSFTGGN